MDFIYMFNLHKNDLYVSHFHFAEKCVNKLYPVRLRTASIKK